MGAMLDIEPVVQAIEVPESRMPIDFSRSFGAFVAPKGVPDRQWLCRWRRLLALVAILPALAWAQAPVDLVSSGDLGDTANGSSGEPSSTYPGRASSDDGRYVVFSSRAANLVDGVVDFNNRLDVFLFDRELGTSQLVSHRAGSLSTSNGESYPVAISGDGRWVTYQSTATDLVAGVTDLNATSDVFLFDRIDGSTTLVSRSSTVSTASANGYSLPMALSADGRWLLYYSRAIDLVTGVTDTNFEADLFLYDRLLGSSRLVSRSAISTTTAVGATGEAALSADGRWAVFMTYSRSIQSGVSDANGSQDAYLYDRDSGSMTLVTHAASSLTTTANGFPNLRAISPDGRWVLYHSRATNVVNGLVEGNPGEDVFVYDRLSGINTLVSRSANSATTTANNRSYAVSISDDGRWVLYYSSASNLISGVSLAPDHAYLFDRETGLATLVSDGGTLPSPATLGIFKRLSLSADGRFVLWNTTQAVLSGVTDGNHGDDAYLFDRLSGSNSLISSSASAPLRTGNGESMPIAISPDGSSILYYSEATDLLDGVADSNGNYDLFLRDRVAGITQLVSRVGSTRRTTANARPEAKSISADGRYVLFTSMATNVVAGQIDIERNSEDIFLHDAVTDETMLVSRSFTSPTTAANGWSTADALSADGRWVLWSSGATDIASGVTSNHGESDVYLFDRVSGQSTLVSHAANLPSTAGNRGAIGCAMSADGRWLLYSTPANDVIPGLNDSTSSTLDVFLVDRLSGIRTLVSHAVGSTSTTANASSRAAALSADGRYVLFWSDATNLIAGQMGPGAFLYDRDTGATVLASRTAGSAVTSMGSVGDLLLSADGQTVVYSSRSVDSSSGITDLNTYEDVFLFDARNGTVTLVSRSAVTPNATADDQSRPTALSADGRRVLYHSYASDLVSGGSLGGEVYVYDYPSNLTTQIVQAAASPTTPPDNFSLPSDISADGNRVLFYTRATNLVAGVIDDNSAFDVYLYELASGDKTLMSHRVDSVMTTANSDSTKSLFSADGRKALFLSAAGDLNTEIADGNGIEDLFIATLPREAPLFADGFE